MKISDEKRDQNMKPKTTVNNQTAVAMREQYITGSVISQDGTTITYRQLGYGPGVVLLHGIMESSQSHMQLAEALADAFTVYLPDRRGRGISGPFGKDHSIQKDVEDMDALLTKTGAHYIFGVSLGGLTSLQAALTLPAIHKAAIYEPPLIINGSVSNAWLTRYDKEMAQGKVAAALVTSMKGAQMGPPIFNVMPRWLLELLTKMMMASEDKKAKGDDVTFRALAPTLHYDGQLVVEMSEKQESFRTMRPEVLLLGGSKSPAYLKLALDALEKVLPQVKRMEFTGLGHGGSGNTDRGGKPERVAQELRRFFA
jgi:pimeloyl-ACP methyl ester carboxylesterase